MIFFRNHIKNITPLNPKLVKLIQASNALNTQVIEKPPSIVIPIQPEAIQQEDKSIEHPPPVSNYYNIINEDYDDDDDEYSNDTFDTDEDSNSSIITRKETLFDSDEDITDKP